MAIGDEQMNVWELDDQFEGSVAIVGRKHTMPGSRQSSDDNRELPGVVVGGNDAPAIRMAWRD
jgi:hypothetical protein